MSLQDTSTAPALIVLAIVLAATQVSCKEGKLPATRGFLMGFTAYPYDVDPADWLSRAQAFAPGKKVAVCETGMIAEDMDLRASAFPILKRGSESWQSAYVERLLADCGSLDAEFVVWWEIRDYDLGWKWLNDHGVTDPLLSVWKDIGLIDGSGRERAGLSVWKSWLDLPRGGAP